MPDRKIHVFTDAPHFLKLIRNKLFDHDLSTYLIYLFIYYNLKLYLYKNVNINLIKTINQNLKNNIER